MTLQANKLKLINNISSCYKMNYSLPNKNIYVKRDDTLDFAFGGNKARFAEYIGKLAVDKCAEKIITFGSIHSNHIRVIACLCNYLNIACDLIILTEENEKGKSGNFTLLSHLENVNFVYCKTSEAHDFIDSYLEKQKNCNYLWIPGGGHMKETVMSYTEVADEIARQEKELGVCFDCVFLPCGTGTTTAGLVYGMRNRNTDIIGVSVARPVERCRNEIGNLVDEIDSDITITIHKRRRIGWSGWGGGDRIPFSVWNGNQTDKRHYKRCRCFGWFLFRPDLQCEVFFANDGVFENRTKIQERAVPEYRWKPELVLICWK